MKCKHEHIPDFWANTNGIEISPIMNPLWQQSNLCSEAWLVASGSKSHKQIGSDESILVMQPFNELFSGVSQRRNIVILNILYHTYY